MAIRLKWKWFECDRDLSYGLEVEAKYVFTLLQISLLSSEFVLETINGTYYVLMFFDPIKFWCNNFHW